MVPGGSGWFRVFNELIPSDAIAATEIGECYAAYRDMLERYRFLTFGMIIAQTVEVLENSTTVFDRVHSDITHLIMDEYQDINLATRSAGSDTCELFRAQTWTEPPRAGRFRHLKARLTVRVRCSCKHHLYRSEKAFFRFFR